MDQSEDYDNDENSGLFTGTKFWVSSLVPGKKKIANLIEVRFAYKPPL
jgi:hypothetical protein